MNIPNLKDYLRWPKFLKCLKFRWIKGPNNFALLIGDWFNFGRVYGLKGELEYANKWILYLKYPEISVKIVRKDLIPHRNQSEVNT